MWLSSRRLTGIAALGFIGAVVAANVAIGSTGAPRGDVPAEAVIAHFAAHAGAMGVGQAVAPVAWVALALFGAGLTGLLRSHEREREGETSWSLVGLTGVAMQNAIFAGVVGTQSAIGRLATGQAPDSAALAAVTALWGLHNALFTLNGTSLTLAMAGFSLGGLRAGLIPGWHAALGLAGAGLTLAGTLEAAGATGFGGLGFAGFGCWVVWILCWAARLLAPAARPTIASATPVPVTAAVAPVAPAAPVAR